MSACGRNEVGTTWYVPLHITVVLTSGSICTVPRASMHIDKHGAGSHLVIDIDDEQRIRNKYTLEGGGEQISFPVKF